MRHPEKWINDNFSETVGSNCHDDLRARIRAEHLARDYVNRAMQNELKALALECLHRAKQVTSAGDRAQLWQIATRYRDQARENGQPFKLSIGNPFDEWGERRTLT